MNNVSTWLATVGVLVAAPAFLLNFVAHGGMLTSVEDADRADGAFSLMFMAGVALIVAGLLMAKPSPVGCKGRWLLNIEATMVVWAAIWAIFIIADPGNIESNSPLIFIGDACWPLHQLFMIVVGIAAVRAGQWPKPAVYALFGPAAGVIVLLFAAIINVDVIAATAIGAGWAIAGMGVIAVTSRDERRGGDVRLEAGGLMLEPRG
jgi:hypothetical protein